MAGTYNRNLYNSALYNAGREEAGALIRSIISAHTGPHVQAVVASTAGVSLISDFIIQEGTVKKPPSSFKFPDLVATLRAVFPGQAPFTDRDPNLPASIRGLGFGDLLARISLTNRIPDLGGNIFGLLEATLNALIVGRLGEHDLAASIFGAALDLPASMNLLLAGRTTPFSPQLPARVFGVAPANLGAKIHTPLDLAATIASRFASDLPASVQAIQFGLLGGRMVPIVAPKLFGFLRAFTSGTADIPTRVSSFPSNLSAVITSDLGGATGFKVGLPAVTLDPGSLTHDNMSGFIRGTSSATSLLSAIIKTGGETDLSAIIDFFGALNLPASVGAIPFGEKNRELPASVQAVRISDLSAVMTINRNVSFLSASISALRGTKDLNAFIRVAETFVTAIMNISTMSTTNLRAVVGRPDCEGGSGSFNLTASATPQFVGNLGASLVSFIETDLGASINSDEIFHSIDDISISFSPTRSRTPSLFQSCDQLSVIFSPFRGQNLSASIFGTIPSVDMGAIITATFPLLRVVPSISRITAADINNLDEVGLQEIRLQLEGDLTEFFYVSGTDRTFSRDANNNWKINIRSFRPIADNLFGEFASARICRLGALTNFATLDQAVRFCIQAVIGLNDQSNLSASIVARGEILDFPATIGISRNFHSMTSKIFPTSNPSSISASITSLNAILKAFIHPVGIAGEAVLTAAIAQESVHNLAADVEGFFVSGSTGAGTGGLGAIVPGVLRVATFTSIIAPAIKTDSLILTGVNDEYVEGPSLTDLGWIPGSKLTVAVWIKNNGTPVVNEAILGNYTDIDSPTAGFGIRWATPTTIEFFINGTSNRAVISIDYPETWQFLVAVYDPTLGSNNIKIYSNHGILGTTQDNYTVAVGNIAVPIFVGKTASVKSGVLDEPHADSHFHELMIWDDALTAAAIRDLSGAPPSKIHKIPPTVNSGNYNFSSSLLLHWDMEDLITTAPTIVPVGGVSTGTGNLVNLNALNVTTSVSPSSPRSVAAVDPGGATNWFASTASALPFVSGYTGSFTVWCLCTFASAGFSAVWGMGDSAQGNADSLRLFKNNTGGPPLLATMVDDAITTHTITGANIVEDDATWYSMIVTYDEPTKTMTLWNNGTLEGDVTLPTARLPQDELTIAANHPDSFGETRRHDGKMETYGFWDRVLTTVERGVLDDLSTEPILTEHATLSTNLTAWYRPGEVNDSGAMVDMSQSNGKNLARSGSQATWISQTYAE